MSARKRNRWNLLVIILLGSAAHAIGLVGQYTVHNGYIQRKLSVSEHMGASGYYRSRLDVPKEYGRLVADFPLNYKPVLWFENEQGYIRNVEINDSFANPLLFERTSHVYLYD